ncbi:MAG: hypothetical protein NC301_07410 [Bacteroides sp.]|nr:hypothetical protein [Bacteroides sp.]MCM1380006.1 hypothetical protein [Bacteroides sp.]MCM1446314.1 hypothetical protein [Prevotella sp.]
MSGLTDTDVALLERGRYVKAFNDTMVKIWREKIAMLGVVDTGALYNSVAAVGMTADGKFTDVTLRQSFNLYGLYVDQGVGSNTWRGNPGDLGYDNKRKRRRWFSRKYYASVMNLREFFADNLGKEAATAIASVF